MKKITIFVILIFGLLGISTSAQTFDNVAPEILEVKVSDEAVDVRTDSKAVFFFVRARDEISGVSNVTLQLHPGSDYVEQLKLERISGDDKDGIYSAYIIISVGSIAYSWTLTAVSSTDAAGNRRFISGIEFAQRGFATGFQVISNSPPPPPFNKRKRRRVF